MDGEEENLGQEGGGEERIEQSNSAARGDTIRNAVQFLAEKNAEIKALREEINEYKATHIKGDLGMKLSDFAAVYRISQMEERDDQDKFLDTLREGFAALGIGGQGDWLAGGAEGPKGNGADAKPRRRRSRK